jgi:site-specific DNA recombinase
MRRIGIYLRVSTEEQARIQDGSLVSQRMRLIEFVEGHNRRTPGWGTILEFYCDEGKSAKNMNRPEFQRLLGDVKMGRVNLVLATELSRLSRSLRDFCEVWDIFKRHEASFVTLREQFDTTTAAGEMMVFNLINFAQYERKQTAERISANWLSRAKRGLWNGGCVPLGFDRNPKNPGQLIPNLEEAKGVQEIYALFLEVESVRKTCRELSKRGAFSKKYTNKHGFEKGGGHFTVPSLFRILTNKAYIGLREIGVKSKEGQTVEASWKPLIDLETFNKAQERLSKNRNRRKPEEWKRFPYPLTEMLTCGECGKHLGGKSAHGKTRKHFYYEHPRQIHSDGTSHLKRCRMERIRAERVEAIVLQSLQKLLSKPGLMEKWVAISNQRTSDEMPLIEARKRALEVEIESKAKRVQNLVARISELPPELPAGAFYDQIKELNGKIAELKNTYQTLLAKNLSLKSQTIDQTALILRLENVIKGLEQTPPELRRPLYSSLIEFAELHPTRIKLHLFAPAQSNIEPSEGLKAPGTDGNANSREGTVLPFAGRGSSTSVMYGAEDENRSRTLL